MKVLLIDGHSLLYRSYFGLPTLMNSNLQSTGGVYGFLSTMTRVQAEEGVDGVVVTFDSKSPTFRHLKHEEYKAGRAKQPQELRSQFPLVKSLLTSMGIPYLAEEGWEADDLLGTLSRLGEEAGWEVVIVTGDKDVLQLISDKTTIRYSSSAPGGNRMIAYTEEYFFEKFGFAPPLLVDYKAIVGDSSDNYHGIKGLGEKKAQPLIASYGTLDKIYEKLQDPEETLGMTPAFLKKLKEGEEVAWFCRDLAEIRRNAPIEMPDLSNQHFDEPKLFQELKQLELYKLIESFGLQGYLEEESRKFTKVPPVSYVETASQLKDLLQQAEGELCSLVSLPNFSGFGIHQGEGEDSTCYLLLEQRCQDYQQAVESLFSSPVSWVVHNSKDLYTSLGKEGIVPQNIAFDVELAGYLLSPESKSYDLEELCVQYGRFNVPKAEVFQKSTAFQPLSSGVEEETALSLHASSLKLLAQWMRVKLEKLGLITLYETIEMPLVPVLVEMESAGISLDRKSLDAYEEKLRLQIASLEEKILAEAGVDFNISSPKQLGEVLFETLGFEGGKKGKTGYRTNVAVLETLLDAHPESVILKAIMEHRQLSKLHSTYAVGLKKAMDKDGKIHCTFQNTVTATGRLSCSEPNLQNIPIRTSLGAELRTMFVAEEGRVLIDADYSQIELRLLSSLAEDEAMIEAFLSGADFHQATASRVFQVPLGEVTEELRRAAKAVNFGVIYGMGPSALAADIGVTQEEAKQYIEDFFRAYPSVGEFFDQVLYEGKRTTTVSTFYGRKRWIPDLRHSNFSTRAMAERMAMNMPIQGTAADIMKLAMLAVDARLKREAVDARLLLQVHDEVIVDCVAEQGEAVARMVREEMESVAKFAVPLLVEAKYGTSWAEAH